MATCTRDAFYVGGRYVGDDTGKHTMHGQMYVEHLVPAPTVSREQETHPIIFVHGGTRTGAVSQDCVPFDVDQYALFAAEADVY